MATLDGLLVTGSYTLALRALVMAGNLSDVLLEVPGDVLDGSVSMDRTRQLPRMASCTLDNTSGLYLARTNTDWTWPMHVWRIERGAMVDGVAQYVPLMTGFLNGPKESVRSKSVPFSLTSRLLLLNTQFSGVVVFADGTRLQDVVYTTCVLFGLGADPALYVLDDGGRALQADRSVDVQDVGLNFLAQLCKDNALDLSDDALGRVTLAPWQDPSTAAVAWVFDPTVDALTLDVTRQVNAPEQVFNRVIVTGVAPDTYPIEAQARDLNPDSPTYNPVDGSGPIGDRPAPRYVSSDIHDQATLNAAALRRLYEAGMVTEPVDVDAMPLPGVEDNQIVQINGAGADDTYRLDTVTMPFRGGNMQLAAQRVRSMVAP